MLQLKYTFALQRKNNENVQAYLFRYFYSGNSIQKNGIKTIKLDLDKINFSNKMLYEELCNDVFLNLCIFEFPFFSITSTTIT